MDEPRTLARGSVTPPVAVSPACYYSDVPITPAKKFGWYVADQATVAPLFQLDPGTQVPGLSFAGKGYNLHRSHLPLLVGDQDAVRTLVPAQRPDWAARDRLTKPLGFTLRNVQHAAIDYTTQRRGTLLGDDPRVGKGHPHGTRVLGPDGWRCIEDVRVGDQVFGADGRPTTITGVFPRGQLPVFRVGFSDGSSVRVDGDHLWAAWDHNAWHRGKAPSVLSTATLAAQLCDPDGKRRWRIPLVKPLEFIEKPLPLDPYLLGVLLGDGSLTTLSVAFCCGDEDVPREVERVLPADVKLTCSRSATRAAAWRIVEREKPAPGKGGGRPRNSVLTALYALGLMGTHSYDKFVPPEFLRGSPAQRLALLQGLLDTDGEYSGGKLLQFSSASEKLCDAVRFLVESLGGVARASLRAAPKYTYKGERRTGRPSYRLTIAMPAGVEPFRARKGCVQRQKFQPTRHIDSIEPDGEAEVICISVAAPDRLYVTEHCIVTHNTLSAIMSHDPASGPLVVICPAMVRPVWLGWLRRVFPDEPIGIMTGRTFDFKALQNKIIVGHYDILPWWQSAMPLGTIVFDEAHMLTNRGSRRSKAAIFLARRASQVIAATGTPIWNMPPDLWNVLGLVAPGAFGGFHEFALRYGAPEPTAYGTRYLGISNERELRARLSEVMIRRRWVDVADDLPAISRSVVLVELDEKRRRKLDLIAADIASNTGSTIGHLSRYREQLSHVKAPTIIKQAQDMLDRGEPVVVWTWHVALADKIAAALGERAFLLTGEVASKKRDDVMDAWKAHPAAALVCTMSVAQVGLDFSHAHLAIFGEIDYTPAILTQAEMRTYAPTRPMNVTYVVADHLIEQRIVLALTRKLSAADPLGVGAAGDAITTLQLALQGPVETPDLDRLLEDLLGA
jgi:hypothetical protein